MQPESLRDGRHWPLHPELRTFRCESALPDPLEPHPRPEPLTVRCQNGAPTSFLNEKYRQPQCQKMVSWTDLIHLGVIACKGGRFSIPVAVIGIVRLWRTGFEGHLVCFADFAAAAFFAPPLPSSSSAIRTSLNSCSDPLSALGNRKFSVSSVLTMAEPITTRANHL